ncbi:MAG: hypothetical protein WBC93_23230 [Sulfitobacter sp.]
MRRSGIIAAFAIVLAGQPVAALEYKGQEAAALRCANMLAMTGVALGSTGKIPEVEQKVILGMSVLILDRHVSGTWSQKKAALRVVRGRRTALETFTEFKKYAGKCLEQFPIN